MHALLLLLYMLRYPLRVWPSAWISGMLATSFCDLFMEHGVLRVYFDMEA